MIPVLLAPLKYGPAGLTYINSRDITVAFRTQRRQMYFVSFWQKMYQRRIRIQNYVTFFKFEVNFQAFDPYFCKICKKFRKCSLKTPEIKKFQPLNARKEIKKKNKKKKAQMLET